MNTRRGIELLRKFAGGLEYEQEIETAVRSEEFRRMPETDNEILRIALGSTLKQTICMNLPARGYVEVPSNEVGARFFILPFANVCGVCGAPNTFAPAYRGPCVNCGAKFTYASFKEGGEMVINGKAQGPRVIHLLDS